MKQKDETREPEPVDGELIRPGWVREPDGRAEELRVTLDWGSTDEETARDRQRRGHDRGGDQELPHADRQDL